MRNRAVRLHGQNDLRLDTFELPAIREDEILADRSPTPSACPPTRRHPGHAHKRVPDDMAENPIIVGHEFCGEIEEVGAKWADQFKAGESSPSSPTSTTRAPWAPRLRLQFCGGDSQYAVIIPEVMEQDCLLHYSGKAFFYGSLSEPLSCIIGAMHAQYHTKPGCYVHDMGIVEGGNMAILAGAGPMGLGAIDYAIHCPRRPGLLVVTDIDQAAAGPRRPHLYRGRGRKNGVKLVYVNTQDIPDPVARSEL